MKPGVRWGLIAFICVTAASTMPWGASFAESLADAIRARGLTASPRDLGNLNRSITSYAVFEDGQEFVIAYYVDDGTGGLNEPLFVDRYDKVGQMWKSMEIASRTAQISGVGCLGSVLHIRASPHAFYLGTHLTPSAGCTIVLSRDLAVQTVLPGWFLAIFTDGTIVYQHNQVHFAPTHYAELSLYDQAHRRDVLIYPMKPYQRIRTEHINKVRQVYSNGGVGPIITIAIPSSSTTSSWATSRSATPQARSPSRSRSTTRSIGVTESAGGCTASAL